MGGSGRGAFYATSNATLSKPGALPGGSLRSKSF